MKSPAEQAFRRDIKHSISLLLDNHNPHVSVSPPQSKSTLLHIASNHINRYIEILMWRFKTSLPIIKPIHFRLHHNKHIQRQQGRITDGSISKKTRNNNLTQHQQLLKIEQYICHHPQQPSFDLLVKIQQIKCRLSDIGCLSLSQTVHLLKQMMIGFDVLMDIFGSFSPNQKMVIVNVHNEWRVWISDDYFCNERGQNQQFIDQRELIYKLVEIAEEHCTPSLQSRQFYKEMKEFTYNNQCNFIRSIEKIKQFVTTHKILQVSKVTLPFERKQKKHLNHQPEKQSNHRIKLNKQSRITFNNPFDEIARDHSFGKDTQNHGIVNSKSMRIIGTSCQIFNNKKDLNESQLICSLNANITNPLQRSPSSILTNISKGDNYFTNEPPLQFSSLRMKGGFHQSSLQHQPLQGVSLQNSHKFTSLNPFSPNTSKLIRHKEQNIGFKSSINIHQSTSFNSTTPILNRQSTSYTNLNKSRHELKMMMKDKKSNQTALAHQPQKRKPQRKYSQQFFKAMSPQPKKDKKCHISSIHDTNPQISINGLSLDIIRKQHQPLGSNLFEKKQQSSQKLCTNNQYNSSLSTKQLHNSRDRYFNNGCNRQNILRINEPGYHKRNNQSSFLQKAETSNERHQKSDKIMAVSSSFKTTNDLCSDSSQSPTHEQGMGNSNWVKKLSGLFSDDASIKQLKESVQFKGKQKIFQKQHLKNVKLDMLQKFGRKVRHSIVDEDDDIEPKINMHSMQLIEEVFDDQGRSHIEQQEIVDEQMLSVRQNRCRNHTVQIKPFVNEDVRPKSIERKQCVSEYFQSGSDSSGSEDNGGFKFQSQNYVINPKA